MGRSLSVTLILLPWVLKRKGKEGKRSIIIRVPKVRSSVDTYEHFRDLIPGVYTLYILLSKKVNDTYAWNPQSKEYEIP